MLMEKQESAHEKRETLSPNQLSSFFFWRFSSGFLTRCFDGPPFWCAVLVRGERTREKM